MNTPTPAPKSTPRDVFLYLLAIITLYLSVWRLIDLQFSYIDVLVPDALHNFYSSIYDDVRLSISMLIVVFPIYLGLTWFLRKDVIKNPEKHAIFARKFLLSFTLFLTALIMIGDLVTLINNFLNGELTLHFFLKVFTVLIVVGAVFAYYLWDLKRETPPHGKPSKLLAVLASVVVAASIVSAFFVIGTPAQQRLVQFDDTRLSHLQAIQSEIISYWNQKNKLPAKLGDLKNDITGFMPPVDPATQASYDYTVKGKLVFDLCADFATSSKYSPSRAVSYYAPYPASVYDPQSVYGSSNWDHEKGHVCFTRTIDPELFKTPTPLPFK